MQQSEHGNPHGATEASTLTSATPGLVSVVIATFNREKLLLRAFESVLAQSYRPIEVLIVDNASTDRTASVVPDLIRRAESLAGFRAKYLRESTRGPSAARNCGLRSSTGEYIQFLDDDDVLDEGKIASQVKALGGHGTDVCVGSYRYMDADGKVQDTFAYRPSEGIIRDALVQLLNGDLNPIPSNLLFRRSGLLANACSWDESLMFNEDRDLLGQVLCKGLGAVGEPAAVTYYCVGGSDRLSNASNAHARVETVFHVSQKFFALLKASGRLGAVRAAFSASLARAAVQCWTVDRASAKQLESLALRIDRHARLSLGRRFAAKERWLAAAAWKLGGVRLCGRLFELRKRALA